VIQLQFKSYLMFVELCYDAAHGVLLPIAVILNIFTFKVYNILKRLCFLLFMYEFLTFKQC